MAAARASAARHPLIVVGKDGEFGDIKHCLASLDLLEFPISPDTLQGLDTIETGNPKTLLDAQDLALDRLPDSPNGSYQDSSSESTLSSKMADGSAEEPSSGPPVDAATDQSIFDDLPLDHYYPDYTVDYDADPFACDQEAHSLLAMDNDSFSHYLDILASHSDSALSRPEAPPEPPSTASALDMPSPGMPTINNSPRKPEQPQSSLADEYKRHASVSLRRPPPSFPLFLSALIKVLIPFRQIFSMLFSTNYVYSANSQGIPPLSAPMTSHSTPSATMPNSPLLAMEQHVSKDSKENFKWSGGLAMPRPDTFSSPPRPRAPPLSSKAQPDPPLNTGYELTIMPTPPKSRVETQIPLKMIFSPLPQGITHLHLPTHTISKAKLVAKPTPQPSPHMLELSVNVVCTSAMERPELRQQALRRALVSSQRQSPEATEHLEPQNGGDVHICSSCIVRERKRAGRKKIKNPEDEMRWHANECHRVVVFNSSEVKKWEPLSGVVDSNGRAETAASSQAMQIEAPMRIACYCRHHGEKMGFHVIFTIKNHMDQVLAQTMSNPIMVTDDHKTHPMAQSSSQPTKSEALTLSSTPANSAAPPPAAEANEVVPAAQKSTFCVPKDEAAAACGHELPSAQGEPTVAYGRGLPAAQGSTFCAPKDEAAATYSYKMPSPQNEPAAAFGHGLPAAQDDLAAAYSHGLHAAGGNAFCVPKDRPAAAYGYGLPSAQGVPTAAYSHGLPAARGNAFYVPMNDTAAAYSNRVQGLHLPVVPTPNPGRTDTAPTRGVSRPRSPSDGRPVVKRKKPSGGASPLAPDVLATTRPGTSLPSGAQPSNISTSPFALPSDPIPLQGPISGQFCRQPSFDSVPSTPATIYHGHRSASVDNLAMTPYYPAPASSMGSHPSSPGGLPNGHGGWKPGSLMNGRGAPGYGGPRPGVARNPHAPQAHFAAWLANGQNSPPNGDVPQVRSQPMIFRAVPEEGPRVGGIEVVLLGRGFYPGLQVYFGSQRSPRIIHISRSTILCLLPPSPVAGVVPVTLMQRGTGGILKGFPEDRDSQPPPFRYIDDNEMRLMRTALAVIGRALSPGSTSDVNGLESMIANYGSLAATPGRGPNQAVNGNEQHIESQLLRCLDLVDLGDGMPRMLLDWDGPTGHTMLQLACCLGYQRLVAALLARGANSNARDRGGFTPLHMAAMDEHVDIVRRLLSHGADPAIRSESGLVAAGMTRLRAVRLVIFQWQHPSRSPSSPRPSHSSASSSSTEEGSPNEPMMRAQPMTMARAHNEPMAPNHGAESRGYRSGGLKDNNENHHALDMEQLKMDMARTDDIEDGLDAAGDAGTPPTKHFAAFKDQLLHQIQHTMGLQIPNFSPMPQMPQMPTILPTLVDYQPPLFRRMHQFMAGSGPRTGMGDGSKWDSPVWEILPYLHNGMPPPPSYEDVCGHEQEAGDLKHGCEAEAAAEAEADTDSSASPDGPSTAAECKAEHADCDTEPLKRDDEGVKRESGPSVLNIGRKHAITKEQQEQLLLAHQRKLKKIGSDPKLFLIWVREACRAESNRGS